MRVPILLYHWFDDGRPTASPEFGLRPQVFRQQMEWLKDSGYRVLPLGEVTSALKDGRSLPDDRPVTVITFDDAYADFLDHAAPVLSEMGFPATVFAVSGHVGETNSWDFQRGESPRELLDWAGLRELSAAGIEIGSHSRTHPDLRSLDDKSLDAEMTESRKELEDGLGCPVPQLAYPHGLHDERVRQAAHRAGYDAASAVLLEPLDMFRSDDLALMRAIIHGTKSDANFRLRLRLAAPCHRRS